MITRLATAQLIDAVDSGAREESFKPILVGIRDLLHESGLGVDRLSIPMNALAGFRHPTIFGIQLAWSRVDDTFENLIITHDERRRYQAEKTPRRHDDHVQTGPAAIDSPFGRAATNPRGIYRVNLTTDELDLPILNELKDAGFSEYLVYSLSIPGSESKQTMSLSTTSAFPPDVMDRLDAVKDLISLTLYAAYRTSQALTLADVYLGRQTGRRVLMGEIVRGQTEDIESGLMFCDVRGFTQLTERIGGAAIVDVMNELFAIIGQHAEARGGEILKFIGDAMLVVFPTTGQSTAVIARDMADCVRSSLTDIQVFSQNRQLELGVGFGCHIGKVVYGNIGTPTRLDFTVMGPAVNLASRLESLTKAVGVSNIFSKEAAQGLPELNACGA